MLRVIVGTAGHIDHGKTRLLEALTGIDCDRWAEEKARGITIDLGFAHLEAGDLQLGFVDVPGHERFLHNALAGLGGICIMLLVVAADEGVKPQTREHLAICSLLGIRHAVVALTKRDLVDPDLLELAQLELDDLLATTPFAGAPILAVSSTTGLGLEELRQTLVDLARTLAASADGTSGDGPEAAPFRLPVDRAFQLRGLGAVVTGTLVSGHVEPGRTVSVLPAGLAARVRSIEVHGHERSSAAAGERTALQLTGVGLEALERGVELTDPESFAPTRTLCARLTLLADAGEPLASFVPVRFHLYASEVLGKLRPLGGAALAPGDTGLVEIRLAKPVVAVRGDRFIVRRPSPAATLGGGEILDPLWRRRRGKELTSALAALADRDRALRLWVRETGERGVTAAELAPRLGGHVRPLAQELEALAADGRLVAVDSGRGRRFLAPEVPKRVMQRAAKLLADYFAADRLARGMPKAQLLEQLLPKRAADLAGPYLQWLEAEKVLQTDGVLVNLPGRAARLSGDESQLAKALLERVEAEGLTPPSPAELNQGLGAKPQILEGVMRYLVEQGKLVRLPSGLVLSRAAIEALQQELLASDWQRFSVSQFKDRFGLSRKWAIPLLEHLDSVGFTRRLGDDRQIVRR